MRPRSYWFIVAAASFGFFMAILDTSIVTIAIPAIERSLKTNIDNVTWVLNAYNLVFAVLLIPAGRVADRFGRKKLFIAGLVIFTVFSLVCGFAHHIDLLIAARAFQAVGGAIMVPVSLAILVVAVPPEKRGAAIGIWGAINGVASAVGPTLGGVLTQYVGWEWIFFINVPIGIVGVIACLYIIPESRDPEQSQSVDYPGVLFLSVSLFTLTLALIRGETNGWSSPFILGLFGAFAITAVLFVLTELRVREPLVDLRMLQQRTFSAANTTMLLLGVGFFGSLFLGVQYLTVVEGYSVLRAALAITPLPAMIAFVAPVSGRLSDRVGPRAVVPVGLFVFGLALLSFSYLGVGASYPHLVWRFIIAGIGLGLSFPPLASAAMGVVFRGKQGVGAGVFNTSRQIGFTVGLAVLVAVFLGALHPRLSNAQTQATTIVQQSNLPDPVKQGIIQGINNAVSSNSAEAAQGGEQQKFDLYSMVAQAAGQQVADTNKASLDQLSQQLQRIFAVAAAHSFDRAFLVGWLIVWLAAGTALLMPSPPAAGRRVAPGTA
ncbi:MAG: MFS transporter [Dehalococcoidia bacterium]|jgi:EmrB/QacA subfamily drug resistance transporter